MKMVGIKMCSDYHLIPLSPNSLRKFHTNRLCLFGRYILLLETEITVISLYAVRLSKSLFDLNKLLTGNRRITVDALNKKLLFGFLFILGIGQHIGKSLILFVREFRIVGFIWIGGIINYFFEVILNRP